MYRGQTSVTVERDLLNIIIFGYCTTVVFFATTWFDHTGHYIKLHQDLPLRWHGNPTKNGCNGNHVCLELSVENAINTITIAASKT